MTLAASFSELETTLGHLESVFDNLLWAVVQAAPEADQGHALVDHYEAIAADLIGTVKEARIAVKEGRKRPRARKNLSLRREALVTCQTSYNAMTDRFYNGAIAFEWLEGLDSLASERGGEWAEWALGVHDALRQCPPALHEMGQALFRSWMLLVEMTHPDSTRRHADVGDGGRAMKPKVFRITGRVIDQAGRGLEGVRVEAWDKDLLVDQHVAEAVTQAAGNFEMTYTESTFRDVGLDPWPDIFFRVYREESLIASTEATGVYRAGQEDQEVLIVAALETSPEVAGPAGRLGAPEPAPLNGPYGTITGRAVQVTAEGEQPLGGVEVTLVGPNQAPRTEITDESEGRFTFDQVNAGDWVVQPQTEIDQAGRLGQSSTQTGMLPRLRLAEPDLASIHVQLHLGETVDLGAIGYEIPPGIVRGTLSLGGQGQPRLEGVPVSLVNVATRATTETRTDAQGGFYFDSPVSGLYRLIIPQALDLTTLGLGEGKLQLHDKLPGAFFVGPGAEVIYDTIRYRLIGGDIRGEIFFDRDRSGKRFGPEPGVEGVQVVLADERGRLVDQTTSRGGGDYRFRGIPPGVYSLRFAAVVKSPAHDDELVLTTPRTSTVVVKAGETAVAEPAGYGPDVHEIKGRAVFDDGTPIEGLLVSLADLSGNEIDTAVTDQQGNYSFTGRQGQFTVRFPDDPFAGQILTLKTRTVAVESAVFLPDTVYRRSAPVGGVGAVRTTFGDGGLQESIADIASYMPTSQEAGGVPIRGGLSATGAAEAPLQQVVDVAMAEVLGRKLTTSDPTAFLQSLNRAITIKEVEGERDLEWTPRSYAIQTELGGAITGAQASLYHRAKSALDDALPLIEGLKPLLASPDLEEIEAARSILRTEFIELVDELGLESGPRAQRVDDIFTLLLRQLDRVEEVFGFSVAGVITVDEERSLTDFLVVRDYIVGLEKTWEVFRDEFANTRFLGTQLVLLARGLSTVAESVDETVRAMDSVLLGPAERQTVLITFPAAIVLDDRQVPVLEDGSVPPPILVDDLLTWVARFAGSEGPTLIQDGGKRGVELIEQIADRLSRLVLAASQAQVPHIGFTRERVRRALEELALQLAQVARFARELDGQPAVGTGAAGAASTRFRRTVGRRNR